MAAQGTGTGVDVAEPSPSTVDVSWLGLIAHRGRALLERIERIDLELFALELEEAGA